MHCSTTLTVVDNDLEYNHLCEHDPDHELTTLCPESSLISLNQVIQVTNEYITTFKNEVNFSTLSDMDHVSLEMRPVPRIYDAARLNYSLGRLPAHRTCLRCKPGCFVHFVTSVRRLLDTVLQWQTEPCRLLSYQLARYVEFIDRTKKHIILIPFLNQLSEPRLQLYLKSSPFYSLPIYFCGESLELPTYSCVVITTPRILIKNATLASKQGYTVHSVWKSPSLLQSFRQLGIGNPPIIHLLQVSKYELYRKTLFRRLITEMTRLAAKRVIPYFGVQVDLVIFSQVLTCFLYRMCLHHGSLTPADSELQFVDFQSARLIISRKYGLVK